LENIGESKLGRLCSSEDFNPIRLVELIRQGEEALRGSTWGITPSVAQALLKLEEGQLLELQEIDMTGEPVIELNVNHTGDPLFKPLTELSTGQQCTAILHLLLLDNKDPLILDQPEDNLDNAFIADRIVTTLRQAKLQRQFIFATHNANIPVFGDAEWIGVLEADNESAHMPPDLQGAIDQEPIRDRAAVILEGGKAAFTQRREKYGYP
jgi:energy-coupling factor transporter ATP-binding protein EcfA2